MGPKTLEFWFEFASPYAYLSAMRITALAAEKRVQITPRAFLLGPVFAAQGWDDSPFNIYPAKGAYLWQDVPREAAALGLPFHKPGTFPRGSLLATRIVCAHPNEPWTLPFAATVFRANFAEDRDINTSETIAEILSDHGLEADSVIHSSTTADAKAALRAQTERAMSLGIFGAPSFTVGAELFWGNDRLERALEAAA